MLTTRRRYCFYYNLGNTTHELLLFQLFASVAYNLQRRRLAQKKRATVWGGCGGAFVQFGVRKQSGECDSHPFVGCNLCACARSEMREMINVSENFYGASPFPAEEKKVIRLPNENKAQQEIEFTGRKTLIISS